MVVVVTVTSPKVGLQCPDCGKSYSTSSNLARHRQTHRSIEDKKARKCPHCDKTYVSMPAYSMHIRTHNQGCKCPFCGKCFSRPWLLQGHIRTHTAFADKSNLRAHIQTHSNTQNPMSAPNVTRPLLSNPTCTSMKSLAA
ncbi:SCRT [Lepeophtheirus salmonis]|uniref:SCRT n=1 Tax=Lepeophtheirus salmonis TaxID=72036 RepID=A0A7R8CLX9_LEPSM|nr:SCRT [Lepeophtheirus salmonis]CAF2860508.1 SCRT [Lepeophtheirus salmonis]